VDDINETDGRPKVWLYATEELYDPENYIELLWPYGDEYEFPDYCDSSASDDDDGDGNSQTDQFIDNSRDGDSQSKIVNLGFNKTNSNNPVSKRLLQPKKQYMSQSPNKAPDYTNPTRDYARPWIQKSSQKRQNQKSQQKTQKQARLDPKNTLLWSDTGLADPKIEFPEKKQSNQFSLQRRGGGPHTRKKPRIQFKKNDTRRRFTKEKLRKTIKRNRGSSKRNKTEIKKARPASSPASVGSKSSNDNTLQ
jgi:hypothetical protein